MKAWSKMTTTSRLLPLFAALVLLSGCERHTETFFDTPFVRIEDATGMSTMGVDHTLDNQLTEIRVIVSASKNYFTAPITVDYEVIVGNGLKEGTDFRIQSSHRSPLTFSLGTYSLPIRLIWYKSASFDPSKDNTLTLRLTGCSVPEMLLGVPGPDEKKKEFIFKQL